MRIIHESPRWAGPARRRSLDSIDQPRETKNYNRDERKDMSTEVHTDRLVRDLKTVARDAQDLIKATAGDVGEKAREARTRLAATLESAKESLDGLQERAVAGAKATDRAIREHPYQSLGIAFGVGVLIGVLVNRRNGHG